MFSERIVARSEIEGCFKSRHFDVMRLGSYHTLQQDGLTESIDDDERGVEIGAVIGMIDD